MIERMLEGTEVMTGVDFLKNREQWLRKGRHIVYTGMADELMDYRIGELPYRSLRFETETVATPDYQGMAVVNEAEARVPYTRTIEHKHFSGDASEVPVTIITREYPQTWTKEREAYYPVRDKGSEEMYNRYVEMARAEYPSITFGGRLGLFRYLDMDDTIAEAMARMPDNN